MKRVETLVALSLALASINASDASELEPSDLQLQAGKNVYFEHCARCHGDDGQGKAEEYDEPLFGDRSIKSLAGLIERTMPEDKPESVTGPEARQVAAYIYHDFYSPTARKKFQPRPRIELSRLTVSQYRNSIADLIGQFSWPSDESTESELKHREESLTPGLAAEYFQSKGMSKADKLKIERIDSTVDFDFGEGSPAEDITADQFAAIWQGALMANETGHYEFRITTQNGARLYLNTENTGQRRKMRDDSSLLGQRAIVDAWVSSGEMQEHTARVFLLGGRHYPIRLEFFKYKEEAASIKFEWKPPHDTWQLLDERFVHTGIVPRTYVVPTPFPPDDRSAGYERGSAVSAGWHEAVTQGAIATATEVVNRLPQLAGLSDDDSDRLQPLQNFLKRFARYAFRRPLSSTETERLNGLVLAHPDSPETAIRKGILLVLTSPSFLYITPKQPNELSPSHTIASRLALSLWDSVPDNTLRLAAEQDELSTDSKIRDQIDRMIHTRATRAKLTQFFRHWLEVEERDLSKDQSLYPEFDEHVVSDLRYSLELFINEVIWSEASDYRELLLTDKLYLNRRLSSLYAPAETTSNDFSSGQDFRPVAFSRQRSGILTHPFLLSAFAYHDNTSPIHRGVFLTRNVMGRGLKPPPQAVAFKNDEFPQDLSMREKITRLTSDAACMTCHSIINPLGFALENFDAVGRFRTTENDAPVDTASEYITIKGDSQHFESARDLAQFAVKSTAAHQAFVAHLFRHLVKQPPQAYGDETLDDLRLHFSEEGFSIRQLVAEIAWVAATHGITTNKTKSAL